MKNREKQSSTVKNNNSIMFLNLPIGSSSQDVIGLDKYAERLSTAIDSGAQTIAVTSEFGMGKTSVVELLKEKRAGIKNERILNVPMWMQLSNAEKADSVLDLHRNFIYQIARQIHHRRGTYISRRLSPNYRLLKLHTNKPAYWILMLLAIISFAIAWAINAFHDQILTLLPLLRDSSNNISLAAILLAVILGIVAIAGSEIIISTGKSEKDRKIESDEIIELYYSEILKYRILPNFCRSFCLTKRWYKNYIIVIEDLDRSNQNDAIKNFLKEIRKYYIPSTPNSINRFRNRVIFIVNIKPESEIKSLSVSPTPGSLYDKLFDYVLNIQTINIDDYSTILEGLLESEKEKLTTLGLYSSGTLSSIPGMQWIIREPKVGMREIKDRLNRTFSLYESLCERFPHGNIAFEKCAVVAYITTAFEAAFYATEDSAYQKIVEWSIKSHISGNEDADYYKKYLPKDDTYSAVVLELVNSGLIDTNYRMYFYNYPKNSRIYTIEESQVQKAILYGETFENLNQCVSVIEADNSSVLDDSLVRLKQLGLPLPDVVFETESLYLAILRRDTPYVIQWLNKRDYKKEATEKTIAQVKTILRFDAERRVFNSETAAEFAQVWEKHFSEDQLLRMRRMVCQEFSSEVLWYKQLFRGVHSLVRQEEQDLVSFENAIELIDQNNNDFSIINVEYLLKRYSCLSNREESQHTKLASFMENAATVVSHDEIAPLLLAFMRVDGEVVGSLESIVIDEIHDIDLPESKKEELISNYKKLIVAAAPNGLSEQTLQNICSIEEYGEYNSIVAYELDRKGHYFEAAMVSLLIDSEYDLLREEVINAIEAKKAWLINKMDYFLLLRSRVVKTSKAAIEKYIFLFAVDCPILSETEFKSAVRKTNSDALIISIVPPQLVTDNEVQMLAGFFNRKWHRNGDSLIILEYIAKFSPSIASNCFKSLNFDSIIKYQDFSAEKKRIIKRTYNTILNLETPSGKVSFMQITKCLDNNWENEIQQDLIDNTQLREQYIQAVNHACAKSMTQTTIKNLCSFSIIYAMAPHVTDLLFKNKKYNNYIVSKILWEKIFTMETGDRGSILWPYYVQVFKSNNYTEAKGYIRKNGTFLRELMNKKEYVGMDADTRLLMAGIYQDSESLLDVLNYGNEFALKYYLEVSGFTDENAASTFVDIVEDSQYLLSSRELYEHSHDKLVSGVLKGRYTRLRKKQFG